MSRTLTAVKPPARTPSRPPQQEPIAREPAPAPACPESGFDFGGIVVHPLSSAPVGTIQTKLQVDAPEDRYEQEADRVADTVVGGTAPSAPPAPSPPPPPVTPKVTASLTHGGGSPLPSASHRFYEPHFGDGIGHVRIHTDPEAAQSAQALNARAFTCGSHIYFGAGEYQPETRAGRHLLTHEIVHTVQQRGGTRGADVLARQPAPPAPASVSSPSVEAIAGEVETILQSDPEDSAGQARARLRALDPMTRTVVVARVRSRVPLASRDRLSRLLEETGPQRTSAAGASPAARGPETPTGRTPGRPTGRPTPTPPSVPAPPASAVTSGLPTPPSPTAAPEAAPPSETPSPQSMASAGEATGAQQEAAATGDTIADATASSETDATQGADTASAEGEETAAETGGDLPNLSERVAPVPEEESVTPLQASEPRADGTIPEETSGPEPTPADVGALVAQINEAAAASGQQIGERTTVAQSALAARAAALRSLVSTQVAARVTALRAAFSDKRSHLDASVTAAHGQIETQLTARLAEVDTKGTQARERFETLFTDHRTHIDTTVSDNITAAETLRTRYATQLHERTQTQAATARRRGASQAASYPNSERGRIQAQAAEGVAEQTAAEMEAREPEAVSAIEEVVAEVPAAFEQQGQEALTGFDDGLPDLLAGVDEQVGNAQNNLNTQAQQASSELETQATTLRTQLATMESAAIAQAEAVGPQILAQIDGALAAGRSQLGTASRTVTTRIREVVDQAIGVLSGAEAPEAEASQQFTDEILTFITDATESAGNVLTETGTELTGEFDRVPPALSRGLTGIATQTQTSLDSFSSSADTGISDFVTGVDTSFGDGITQLQSGFDEAATEVQTRLDGGVDELRSRFQATLDESEGKISESVTEGTAKNDEALGELGPQMREAASDAAWDYDHPVLSTLRDIGAFIAGALVAILAVIVLVVIVIVAFKAIVAGLVFLGLSLAAAKLVVLVAGLALLAYGLYSAYSARRERGQGVLASLGGAVLDLTGITQIVNSITTPNLSPYERGKMFGEGAATLASFFVLRGNRMNRLNAAIDSKLPNAITNPTRGGLWRGLASRFGNSSGGGFLNNMAGRFGGGTGTTSPPAAPGARPAAPVETPARPTVEPSGSRPAPLAEPPTRPTPPVEPPTRPTTPIEPPTRPAPPVEPPATTPRPATPPTPTTPAGPPTRSNVVPFRQPAATPRPTTPTSPPRPATPAAPSRPPSGTPARPTPGAPVEAPARSNVVPLRRPGTPPRPTAPGQRMPVPVEEPVAALEASGAPGYRPRPLNTPGRPTSTQPGGVNPLEVRASAGGPRNPGGGGAGGGPTGTRPTRGGGSGPRGPGGSGPRRPSTPGEPPGVTPEPPGTTPPRPATGGAQTQPLTPNRVRLQNRDILSRNPHLEGELAEIQAMSDPAARQTALEAFGARLQRIRATQLTAEGETLLLGEGDFSLARSLAEGAPAGRRPNITATSYEPLPTPGASGPHPTAEANLAALERLGARVQGNVDARNITGTAGRGGFDEIAFTFPHTKAARPVSAQVHRSLLSDFFGSARQALNPGGRVRVTMVDPAASPPYQAWRIQEQAAKQGFRVAQEIRLPYRDFQAAYPGYGHQQTGSAASAFGGRPDRPIVTFIFELIQ
jgi:hypothetical protein